MGQVYFPNQGEVENLKAMLNAQALILKLYGNVITPDNTLTMANLVELAKGSGFGYAEVPLLPVVNEGAPIAAAWNIGLNAQGAAQAQYGLATGPVTWTFTADDVAAGETVYGIAAYTWVVPFTAGLPAGVALHLGDTVVGGTSTATGIITGIVIESGSFAGGNAVGYFNIMTKTGNFINGEALMVTWYPSSPAQVATSATGTINGGDALMKLIYVDNFSAGTPIVSVGQQVNVVPTITLITQ